MSQMSRWPNLDILFSHHRRHLCSIPFTFLRKMVVLLISRHLRLEGIGFRIVYHIFVAA
jgi:hypothetical protein